MSLRNTLKILVVDDTSVSRGLLCNSLEDIGMRNVDFCVSGDVAFQRVSREGFHIVISDHHMPGMTGLDLLGNLRMQKSTANVGFILVSGSMNQEILGRAQKLGLNNFLSKLYKKKVLIFQKVLLNSEIHLLD